jgi:hypothetical protein
MSPIPIPILALTVRASQLALPADGRPSELAPRPGPILAAWSSLPDEANRLNLEVGAHLCICPSRAFRA